MGAAKKAFSNPVRAVTTTATLGTSEAARSVARKAGVSGKQFDAAVVGAALGVATPLAASAVGGSKLGTFFSAAGGALKSLIPPIPALPNFGGVPNPFAGVAAFDRDQAERVAQQAKEFADRQVKTQQDQIDLQRKQYDDSLAAAEKDRAFQQKIYEDEKAQAEKDRATALAEAEKARKALEDKARSDELAANTARSIAAVGRGPAPPLPQAKPFPWWLLILVPGGVLIFIYRKRLLKA